MTGSTSTGAASTAASSRPPRWIRAGISTIFGFLYAYDVWEAVGNLVGLNLAAQSLDTTLSGTGWAVLIGAVVLPVAVFAAASRIGRRRRPGAQALILVAGLCLVAVLSLDLFDSVSIGSLIA